jgi:hypothetical protein
MVSKRTLRFARQAVLISPDLFTLTANRNAAAFGLIISHEDKAIAEPIIFSLRGRGHEVFLDRDNLPPSGSYDQQTESAVNDAETFVFLISPNSVEPGATP